MRIAEIYEQRYPALFLDLSSQIKIDSRFITREIIANAVKVLHFNLFSRETIWIPNYKFQILLNEFHTTS